VSDRGDRGDRGDVSNGCDFLGVLGDLVKRLCCGWSCVGSRTSGGGRGLV